MTIGKLGNIGSPAETAYPTAVDFIKQASPIAPEQKNTRDFIGSDYTETARLNEGGRSDDGEKPDFAAINLIKNSFPEPLPERGRVTSFSIKDFIEGALVGRDGNIYQSARQEERVSESATVKTSSEIAEKGSGSGITPARQQGIEQYTKMQNYSNPISMSLASTQFVA
ncbi:MAG: hypothetical protein FWG70_12190 [Oscillospiraceae bacterium]|nr:hypothetical protein [Oscillospiraceae bacterium]